MNQLSLLLDKQQSNAAQMLWPQIKSQISALPLSRTAIYARINLAQSLMKLLVVRGSEQQTTNNEQRTTDNGPRTADIAKLLATAVQQAKDLGDQRAESYALGTLGRLYEQTKQLPEARDLTQKALLLAQSIDASDISYQWQWQLGRLKARDDIKGAILSYGEAVKTLKSLRSDLVAVNTDVQFSFRESVEPVYRQFVDLLLRTQVNSEPSPANLQKARDAIESLQLAELDNFFRSACLAATQQLDRVVDSEAPTAAVIYPIILPDRLEIIVKLPKQQLRHYTTRVSQAEVEDTLEQLRQNLRQPQTRRKVQALPQRVYNWLLQPAERELRSKVETLVFVLDAFLRNIPMAALYDGQQYLIQKYSVALTPGLQLIDPKPLKQEALKALAAGLTENRQYLSPLSNVKRELEEIQSEVPSRVLLNQEFTSTALQNRINSQPFPIVHLATHGQFSSNADQTFILAWDKPIKVSELNNFLRSQTQNCPQAIELLVLSACETATGDKRAALGLAGVAVRAGARSTLASLWNLNDESSALLMSQFYHELATTKVTKAEALRQAQLKLLNQPDYRHPMYWAPYVLVGNWL